MRKVTQIGNCTLVLGNCLDVVPGYAGLHACVTDPPYHLTSIVKRFGGKDAARAKSNGETGVYGRASSGFMGQTWDGGDIAFRPETWAAIASALLPGAHLLAFSGTRTYHRMACAIEDAGLDIRDMLDWVFGTGFPKSKNQPPLSVLSSRQTFEGWGSALKPAKEPICFARKPVEGSLLDNLIEHGTGSLNIDACRMEPDAEHQAKCASVVGLDSNRNGAVYGDWRGAREDSSRRGEASAERRYSDAGATNFAATPGPRGGDPLGRWPANVMWDGSADVYGACPPAMREALRFFYSPKTDKEEREHGLEGMPTKRGGMVSNTSGQHLTRRDGGEPGERANHHPTVKPVALMGWLCRLVTPPGGTVLDPFMGSGSTGIAAIQQGFKFVGVEQSEEYFEIACRRIDAALRDHENSIIGRVVASRSPEPEPAIGSLFDHPINEDAA